jgi:hypothetical protein
MRQEKPGFKLEFNFKEDGLYVCGNKEGLLALARELEHVAAGEDLYHSHLNISWREEMKRGELIIDFDWINALREESETHDFDVTLIKTKGIGKELWREKP